VRAGPTFERSDLRPSAFELLWRDRTHNQHFTFKENPLKRSALDDLESPAVASHPLRVACLPWRDELRLVHVRLDRAMPYTSRLRSESLFSLMTAGRRSRIDLFRKTLPNYSIYTRQA
jgi:hypothetical protein